MDIDQIYLIKLVIGWTCAGVFVCTAVITVLAIVRLIAIDDDLRKKLFAVLIIEVVIIGVGVFGGLVKLDASPVQQELVAGSEAAATLTTIETSKTDSLTAGATNVESAELLPRVYVHIASEDQRPTAVAARTALRDAGYLVPGIENVGTKAPATTQLRYFITDEEALGEKISAVLKGVSISAPANFITGFANANIRPHHFELWFGKS